MIASRLYYESAIDNPLGLYRVPTQEYKNALAIAREAREHIKAATSPPEEMPDDADYYLTPDNQSGVGVTKSGTGIGLFSTVKGRGSGLIDHMIHPEGGHAAWFDHFGGVPDEHGNPTEGYLDSIYKPRGMVEFGRVPNWEPGGPDVVFRVIPENTDRYPDNPYESYGVQAPDDLRREAQAPRRPAQMHGVPWADEDERDEMVNKAKGV